MYAGKVSPTAGLHGSAVLRVIDTGASYSVPAQKEAGSTMLYVYLWCNLTDFSLLHCGLKAWRSRKFFAQHPKNVQISWEALWYTLPGIAF